DNEISGEGNKLDFGERIYDSRLGFFLSTDPLESDFPWQSTYIFASDNPIAYIDFNGMSAEDPKAGDTRTVDGKTEKYTALGTWVEVFDVSAMSGSAQIKNRIKKAEKLGSNVEFDKDGKITKISAYNDDSGFGTIGWGHLIDGKKPFDAKSKKGKVFADGLTLDEAEALFNKDVKERGEDIVQKNVKAGVMLTQNEFDALVYAAYNGASGASLWKMVNTQDYNTETVFYTFLLYRKSGGVTMNGLIKRRAEEAWIYLYADYTPIFKSSTIKVELCNKKGEPSGKTKTITTNGEKLWIKSWKAFYTAIDQKKAEEKKAAEEAKKNKAAQKTN